MWVARQFLGALTQRAQPGLFRRPTQRSRPDLELRYLQCTCCWRSRVPVAGYETLNASIVGSVPCKDDGSKGLDDCYTDTQREVILKLLNNGSEPELAAVKLLGGRKSRNIVEYRTKNGPFKTLESVVNVPLLKHKSVVTVFDSILNPVIRRKKMNIQLAKFIKPEVNMSWLEEAGSIVSLVCGTNKIAWAHVDRGMTVLDWQEMDCPNFLNGAYMASSYLTDVSAVVDHVPESDFYIIEKTAISLQSSSLFPILAHLRVVEAMLFALLEPRIAQRNDPPRVLNMNRHAVGRHFGLIVGESRTSGTDTVKQLMTESVTRDLPRLKFPSELLIKQNISFNTNRRRNDSAMCDALLQALAFYELLCQSS